MCWALWLSRNDDPIFQKKLNMSPLQVFFHYYSLAMVLGFTI
jgi:hypothetical protein